MENSTELTRMLQRIEKTLATLEKYLDESVLDMARQLDSFEDRLRAIESKLKSDVRDLQQQINTCERSVDFGYEY